MGNIRFIDKFIKQYTTQEVYKFLTSNTSDNIKMPQKIKDIVFAPEQITKEARSIGTDAYNKAQQKLKEQISIMTWQDSNYNLARAVKTTFQEFNCLEDKSFCLYIEDLERKGGKEVYILANNHQLIMEGITKFCNNYRAGLQDLQD